MNRKLRLIVGRVLSDAANLPHFFDFSSDERMAWMIARAYAIGKAERPTKRIAGRQRPACPDRKQPFARKLPELGLRVSLAL
ncbi:MAG TPA: hypothetical protein VGN12_19455 [Pirellulales bacterium]